MGTKYPRQSAALKEVICAGCSWGQWSSCNLSKELKYENCNLMALVNVSIISGRIEGTQRN